jgi:hypothetical protein
MLAWVSTAATTTTVVAAAAAAVVVAVAEGALVGLILVLTLVLI